MREQLQQYVALLFAGTQNCEDIQQEILQNTLDRYDDLIAQGKVPEAAYRLAISSIGDINEILGTIPVKNTSAIPENKEIRSPKTILWAIVIGSIVVICLGAILLAGLGLRSFRSPTVTDRTRVELAATAIPMPTEAQPETLTIGSAATVYQSPTEDGNIAGELASGTEVTYFRKENVMGKEWAYITSPVQGWLLMEEQETQKATVTEPVIPAENTQPAAQDASGYSCPAEDVSSISIEWLSGNIQILAGEGNRIRVEETEGDTSMVTRLKQGKLSIDFCEESLMKGFRSGGAAPKDLTITVPKDWICHDLEVDAASSTMHFQGLTIQELDIDSASGQAVMNNCTVGSLEVDTASGNITFIGSLDTLECDAVSAHFDAILKNTPKNLEMNSASGNLSIALPSDTGFTVRLEGLKTAFSSDFDTTQKNGAYVYGNGACKIEMESMSGKVTILNADNA